MRLYHGTSTAALGGILRGGIHARGKRKTEWDRDGFPSKDFLVYLTTAYPLFFAQNAAQNRHGSWPMVVEVESAGLSLLPDEDFVGQVLWDGKRTGLKLHRRFGNPSTLQELNATIDPRWYTDQHGRESLESLGTCAVEHRVPLEAITRIAVLNPVESRSILFRAMDPAISILNFKTVGPNYRELVALVMDGTPLPDLHVQALPDTPTTAVDEFMGQRRAFSAALLKERATAVHVFTAPFPDTRHKVRRLIQRASGD